MNPSNQLVNSIKAIIFFVKTILKKIYFPERLKSAFFLTAIIFSPFYLIFKLTIFNQTPLWMLHGVIITLLFLVLVIDRIAKPNKNNIIIRTRMDKLVLLLLLYFIWSAVFGVVNGSAISNLPRIFWQFIIGVLVYFVAKNYLTNSRLKISEITIWVTFSIVISLLLAEFVAVNLLGKKSFFWTLAFYQQGFMELWQVSYGGSSLSWKAFKRITGFFGNHSVAATFISIGVAFSLFKILLIKIKFFRLVFFVLALLTFIFTSSRFPVLGLTVAVMVAFMLMPLKYKRQLLIFLILLTIIASVAIIFSGENVKYLLKTMYIEKMYTELFQGDVLFGTAARYVERDWTIFVNNFKLRPWLIFTGAGLGYFDDQTLVQGGEFGWLIFFSRVGLTGFLLIGIIFLLAVQKIKAGMKDERLSDYRRYLMLASLTYMITAVVATFHSGAIFHSANYLFFFLCLAIISFIDEKRQTVYNAGDKSI